MPSLRTSIAAAATVLVALGIIGAPTLAMADTVPTSAATAQPAATTKQDVTMSISPASDGVVQQGKDMQMSLTVTNHTGQALPAATAELYLIRTLVSSREDLTDWVDNTSLDGWLGVPVHDIDVPAVAAHESTTVASITVPSTSLALDGYSFGARRIAVAYDPGTEHAVTRSAITWDPSLDASPTDVAVAMPITVPGDDSEVLSASTLAADTAVDGTLTAQLDAAAHHNVAIGIDPRIIASIRLLGVSAPSSAITWLERLEGLRNEKFALSWADADVTGLRHAGAAGIESVISLDQKVDPDDFPGATTATPTPTGTGTPSDSASASASSAPTATSSATSQATDGQGQDQSGQNQQGQNQQQDEQPGDQATIPTTQTLLDFPYTLDGISWPAEDTVDSDDLAALGKAGVQRTIVSNGNLTAGASTTVSASEKAGSSNVLVSDESMSHLLRAAATAKSDAAWQSDMARLTATLATTAHEGTTGTVLLTLGRSWPTDASRIDQTLTALEHTSWVAPTDLSAAASSTQGTVTLANKTEPDSFSDQLGRLVDAESDATAFSTALTDPSKVTAPTRLRVLALASNAWRQDLAGQSAAVDAEVKRAARTVASVGIVDSSSITLLGDRSSLPISVRNTSKDFAVTVYLTVTPSNSFLRVTRERTEVTVQPDSTYRATVPVQSVANGKVQLSLALTSATGVKIASPSTVEINVQAQWESIITGVAAAAVVLIFGLGIVRNVRRRMRRRRLGLEPEDEPDPNRPLDEQPDDAQAADAVAMAAEPVASVPQADHRTGGAPPVRDDATVTAMAGSATALAAPNGDRLEDAIARAGFVPSLPTGHGPTSADADEEGEGFAMAASGPQPTVDASSGNSGRGLGRASALLAAGTMTSRVLGFVKTFVLAAAIGQSGSAAANAFAVSNQLPNSVYTLIAGGLLSAALIPQIVRATKHPDGGQQYINKIVTIGTSVFLIVTLVATAAAPFLVGLYSQSAGSGGKGFSEPTTALAVAFAFWCLPQILFYALYSLLGEVLNARQVFGPFTWAPLLNNVIAIAGLVVFIALFGTRTQNSDALDWTPTKIALLAGTATLGVAVQAAFLVLFWRRAGLTYRPDFKWRGVGLRGTGTAAGWLFLMILTTQLAGVIQSRVSSLGTGAANATLQNAWLLFMLPHSIITVSIATAYFTRMSHDAERGDLGAVRRNLSLSLRIVGLFTVFASVALIVVAYPFARLYEHAFTDVQAMAGVLFAYMPGLVLFSMLFIIQRAFWAMHDHRTPFLMQLVQSILFVIGALAVAALPGSWIGVGVAGVTTIAGCAQTVVALVIVRRRLGGIEGRNVTRSHVQFVIAAIIAGCAGLVVATFFGAFKADGFAQTDITSAGITLVLTGAVMAIVYFAALVVAKNAEVRSAVDLLRARLGR
jgi:murein biosynthesis integral membrane protein MurJ